MTIQIKNLDVLKGCMTKAWDPKLIHLAQWVATRYSNFVITCGYEKRDYQSTHGCDPLRAIDIRSWNFADPGLVVDDINSHWVYDPERPEKMVAIYHDSGRGAHIHLQVHKNTEIKI